MPPFLLIYFQKMCLSIYKTFTLWLSAQQSMQIGKFHIVIDCFKQVIRTSNVSFCLRYKALLLQLKQCILSVDMCTISLSFSKLLKAGKLLLLFISIIPPKTIKTFENCRQNWKGWQPQMPFNRVQSEHKNPHTNSLCVRVRSKLLIVS